MKVLYDPTRAVFLLALIFQYFEDNDAIILETEDIA